MKLNEAIEAAKQLGHTMIDDPPEGGWTYRSSCKECGRAVLSCNGNVYGSAMQVKCDPVRWP